MRKFTCLERSTRLLPAMPLHVEYRPLITEVSLAKVGEDKWFRFNRPQPFTWGAHLDVFQIREDFLSVKSVSGALEFLSQCGDFRRAPDQPSLEFLSWKQFRDWQRMIRAMLTNGPLPDNIWAYEEGSYIDHITSEDDISGYLAEPTEYKLFTSVHPFDLTIGPAESSGDGINKRQLRAQVNVSSVVEGILATVFLDGLRGVSYQLCELEDCTTVYEVISKHQRRYCSQSCAHKASVRRRRAKTETAVQPSTAKPILRKTKKEPR